MSGVVDIPEWTRLADSTSKIGPPDWLPLKDAYRRMRDRLGSSKLAVRDLYAWLRDGQLPSAMRQISSNDEEIYGLLHEKFWRKVSLEVRTAANGTERFRVVCRDDSWEFMGSVYFFVRADVFERLCSTEASAPAPSIKPNRTLRRWSAKYEWDAIYAEIARRCIDPKTRQVKVPKNELKLAEDIRLRWCADTNRSAPGLTDMRAAVHAICVALRKI